MPDAIVVALITGAFAVIAQLIVAKVSNAKLFAELEKRSEVTDTKLEELTREVRAHNNFAQRMPVLEEKIKNLENHQA